MDAASNKIMKGLEAMKASALCSHEFEYLRATVGNGEVGRCVHCKCRFTAWPGTLHYDEIVAAKGKTE